MADETTKTNLPERITFKSVFTAILGLFNLEKGFFYTLWELTVRPGKAIRGYLFEDRTKLSKPFGFLFLAIALSTYVSVTYVFTDEVMANSYTANPQSGNKETLEWMKPIMGYFIDYFNFYLLTTIPFFSFFSYLFYKKPRLYLAEHFVINSYVFAYQTFFYLLMVPLFIIDIDTYNVAYILLSIVYAVYVYTKVFDYETFEGGARGLLTVMASYTVYIIAITVFMIILAIFLVKAGVLEPPPKPN